MMALPQLILRNIRNPTISILCPFSSPPNHLYLLLRPTQLATADIVGLHRKLLEHYPHNSPRNNHHCVSFFKRLCATPLEHEDGHDDDDEEDEEHAHMYFAAGAKATGAAQTLKPTLEPMLYNVPMLALCAKVLNDPLVNGRDTKANFEGVRSFAASLIRHFTRMAASNRVLFADAIFTQAALARVKYCQRLPLHYADPLTVAALSLPLHSEQEPEEAGDSSSSHREQALSSSRATTRSATKPLDDEGGEGGAEGGGEEKEEGVEGESAGAGAGGGAARGEGGGLVDSDEEEFDVDAEVEAVPKKLLKKKRAVKEKQASSSSQGGDSNGKSKKKKWSRGEDAVLKELYAKYADSASVELMLLEGLKEAGYEEHDEADIMQRAKQLNLKAWDVNDEEEDGESSDDDDDEEVPSSQAAFARLMADDEEGEGGGHSGGDNGGAPDQEPNEKDSADQGATNEDDDNEEVPESSTIAMAEDDKPATERQDGGNMGEEDEEAVVAISEDSPTRKREALEEEAEDEEVAPKSRLKKKAKKVNSVTSAKGLSDSDDE